MKLAKALQLVDQHGILLVFPIANRAEPKSLWSVLHPRTPMRWEWDETGDGRVVDLWHARRELAESREVVYSKWFRGRATVFAKDVFQAMLASLVAAAPSQKLTSELSSDARALYELLEDDSPLSTKELKARSGMRGRVMEAAYTRALRELWSRLLVVGAGEVEDGAFPSLAIGATRLLFEDLWTEAHAAAARGAVEREERDDARHLSRTLTDAPSFRRELEKTRAALAGGSRARDRPRSSK